MDSPISTASTSSSIISNDSSGYRRKIVRFDILEDISNNNNNKTIKKGLLAASKWIESADNILICAGNGLSIKDDILNENVYYSQQDFQKHYGNNLINKGYTNGYEAMSLLNDNNISENEKFAYWTKVIQKERYEFLPSNGYEQLKEIISNKNYFVYTSNVDGCFIRSGFDKNRIYRPQGDLEYFQCINENCKNENAFFESKPIIDKLIPIIDNDNILNDELIPKCPYCNGLTFPNIRSCKKFIHTPYDEEQKRFKNWLNDITICNDNENKKLLIIEIGCSSSNTPAVTRYVMESIARDLGNRASFIRINPIDYKIPNDILRSIQINEGWEILSDIILILKNYGAVLQSLAIPEERQILTNRREKYNTSDYEKLLTVFGHFDYRIFLNQLVL